MNAAQNAIDFLMGGNAVDTSAHDERSARREASQYLCSIPDWTGQGGMVHFWQNADGSYESLDSRIVDSEIREGLSAAAKSRINEAISKALAE